jgi:hypothetical protein
MGRKISMPPRSDAPGLKWDRRVNGRQPYWVASQVMRDPMGYPDRSVRLPLDADIDTLAALCRDNTARLAARQMSDFVPPQPWPHPRAGAAVSYSGIIANVHSEPPVGTALPTARRARPPPKPDATVTYCRPLCV